MHIYGNIKTTRLTLIINMSYYYTGYLFIKILHNIYTITLIITDLMLLFNHNKNYVNNN